MVRRRNQASCTVNLFFTASVCSLLLCRCILTESLERSSTLANPVTWFVISRNIAQVISVSPTCLHHIMKHSHITFLSVTSDPHVLLLFHYEIFRSIRSLWGRLSLKPGVTFLYLCLDSLISEIWQHYLFSTSNLRNVTKKLSGTTRMVYSTISALSVIVVVLWGSSCTYVKAGSVIIGELLNSNRLFGRPHHRVTHAFMQRCKPRNCPWMSFYIEDIPEKFYSVCIECRILQKF